MAINTPKNYIEIGSGSSTKFAKKAIEDFNIGTYITSIDPEPRSEINILCDEIIRKPAESVSLDLFKKLDKNDILFIDNSHRSFMNSDATVVFLDILPRLKSGVLVHIHDIFLPNDYPPHWTERYYNEQYLLAAYLLAGGNKFEVVFPSYFISQNHNLSKIIGNLIPNTNGYQKVSKGGGSFWLRIN